MEEVALWVVALLNLPGWLNHKSPPFLRLPPRGTRMVGHLLLETAL